MTRPSAIVTGGARGIGLAIAQRLLASGAACSLWDCDADALLIRVNPVGPGVTQPPVPSSYPLTTV